MDPRADKLRAGYAPVARAYADELKEELSHKPLDRGFLDAFAATVSGPILEVGCGPGQVAAYLHGRGAEVSGSDLSPEMIAAATAAHPEIPFAVADMCALPHASASLAGVIAFYAIVHSPTEELLLPFREFRRVLAPGGHLALAFHAGNESVHVDELFGCATSLDFFFHDVDTVVAALTAAGFALEARLDRAPYQGVEHPTRRCYLLASVPGAKAR